MDPAVLTKRAKYNGPSKKSPAIQGVLMLTEKRFKWVSNDPGLSPSLDHPFTIIKAHFTSKGAKKALLNLSKGDAKDGFVFEFDNFPDRDACRDHVAKILGKQNPSGGAQGGGVPSKPSAPTPVPTPVLNADQFDHTEAMRRMKLLQTDSELQKLHQRLVIGEFLSEAEFWSTRKQLLDDDATAAPKQRVGLKSAMLADLRPMTDGRTNKVTFNLSPEIIRQIFSEKPAVHRAFLTNVPTKMSVSDFWTKYCRAEYLYRTKNQAAAVAEAVDDEELALFMKDDDIIMRDSQQKMKQVDPTVDIAADLADDYTHLPGHGILRDGSKDVEDSTAGVKKRSIMTDINRHAAVVLEGSRLDDLLDPKDDTEAVARAIYVARVEADKATTTAESEADKAGSNLKRRRQERIEQMTLNDDLQGPPKAQLVPLCIQDPRKYFESQQAEAAGDGQGQTSSDPSDALECFNEQLTAFRVNGLREVVMTSKVALKIVIDLNKEMSATRFTLGKSAQQNVLDSLPRSTKDDILQLSATGTEVLRHFWASYPLTTVSLKEKANRLKEAMSQLYNQIQKMKDDTLKEHRHQTSQLLQPVVQALDAAFAHFEETAKRVASKAAQSHATQNGVFPPKPVRA